MRISDWSSDVCSSDLQNELERLERDGVPIARQILEWRQLAKLKSTYTDALQQQIHATTGRVHTTYSLLRQQTGRVPSTGPNLQNIPLRTPNGRQIRHPSLPAPHHHPPAAPAAPPELRPAAPMGALPTQN